MNQALDNQCRVTCGADVVILIMCVAISDIAALGNVSDLLMGLLNMRKADVEHIHK